MGKITRKIKAIGRLRKRKKKQLALQKEEKAVLTVLQSMEIGDIEKVTLQGHTFLARRHPEGFEYSTNSELMDMIDKVGKAFDKVVPKFESESDFEVWRKTLPSWGGTDEEKNVVPKKPYLLIDEPDSTGIVKYGESVPLEEVGPLPPGVAEAIVDIPTYESWMRAVRPKLGDDLGLKWGRDVNASIQMLSGNKVKVRWKALTPRGEAYLIGMAESLARTQLSEPKPQLPGPTNEINNLH